MNFVDVQDLLLNSTRIPAWKSTATIFCSSACLSNHIYVNCNFWTR